MWIKDTEGRIVNLSVTPFISTTRTSVKDMNPSNYAITESCVRYHVYTLIPTEGGVWEESYLFTDEDEKVVKDMYQRICQELEVIKVKERYLQKDIKP